jgi:hypothetical protein
VPHSLIVKGHEIDHVNGHNTFLVQVVEKDGKGVVVGEGPVMSIGISAAAMDKEFGGHNEKHFEQFLQSRKQNVIDTYVRTCACREHGPKFVGREL